MPIIAMTANAFTEDRIRAKEAGMDEHISKPVDAKLLVEVIYKLVD
ncbi:response regulator [Clostridiaceae bacterium AF31-3BH]|nr:response regulator [Clostridiaceae bacterium AF31-3BH]